MPIYDYLCSSCEHRADILHGINDPGPTFCPSCGAEGTLRKQFAAPTIHYKGSGWAKKDRGGSSRTRAGSSSSGSSDSKRAKEGGSAGSSGGGSDGGSGGGADVSSSNSSNSSNSSGGSGSGASSDSSTSSGPSSGGSD